MTLGRGGHCNPNILKLLLNKSFAKLLVRKLVILGLNDACLEGCSNGKRWKLIILIFLVTWERGGALCAPIFSNYKKVGQIAAILQERWRQCFL